MKALLHGGSVGREYPFPRTEAAVGAVVLNRMLAAGQPNSVRTARDAN
ncbi:MAG: hypothetical protein JF606_28965 [Burkholderiales bacterium]|jgi:hypothetical protein|nr:hypothetical protein [Burkholderiales bacterium]